MSKRSIAQLIIALFFTATIVHLSEGHDFSSVPGYSFSKFMMQVQHKENLDQCIEFSISVMHHMAEFREIYAKMSVHTPNIDNEAYHVLKGIQDPNSGIDQGKVGKVVRNKVDNFVDSCIILLGPQPLREDENEFARIPGYFLSKAMMEVRDMQPKNKCINFSIRLMHHLADRKPEYALMSVDTPNIHSISGSVITRLQAPNGLKTNDMTPRFKKELTTFITNCDTVLNERPN